MAAEKINERTRGVYIISPTPFTETGEIDYASTDSLIDFYFETGVTGITILGVLGEAPKLAPTESRAFLEHVMKRVDGRKPIVVGASNPGTDNLVRFAKEAMDLGAAGLMIAPQAGLKTDDQVFSYWDGVLSRLGDDVPVCYQDYPQTTNTVSSVSVLHRLIDAFPNFVMLKHEEGSGLPKITRMRERSDKGEGRRVSILVGNGGLYLPQELQARRRRRHDRLRLSGDAGRGLREVLRRRCRGCGGPVRPLSADPAARAADGLRPRGAQGSAAPARRHQMLHHPPSRPEALGARSPGDRRADDPPRTQAEGLRRWISD